MQEEVKVYFDNWIASSRKEILRGAFSLKSISLRVFYYASFILPIASYLYLFFNEGQPTYLKSLAAYGSFLVVSWILVETFIIIITLISSFAHYASVGDKRLEAMQGLAVLSHGIKFYNLLIGWLLYVLFIISCVINDHALLGAFVTIFLFIKIFCYYSLRAQVIKYFEETTIDQIRSFESFKNDSIEEVYNKVFAKRLA